jgi:hypothetical protein
VGLRNQPNPIKHLEKRKRKIFSNSKREIRNKKKKKLLQNKTKKESINNLQAPISSSTHYSQNRQSTLKSTRKNPGIQRPPATTQVKIQPTITSLKEKDHEKSTRKIQASRKNQPLAQRIIHPASTSNNPGQKSSQAITSLKKKKPRKPTIGQCDQLKTKSPRSRPTSPALSPGNSPTALPDTTEKLQDKQKPFLLFSPIHKTKLN